MDFEAFLRSKELRPMSSVLMQMLLDDPQSASLIARLLPPRLAMMYHAALMRTAMTETAPSSPGFTEHVSGGILAAYGIAGSAAAAPPPPLRPTAAAKVRPSNAQGVQQAPANSALSSATPLWLSYAHHQRAFQHLERTMAAHEAELQEVVMTSLQKCAQAPQ